MRGMSSLTRSATVPVDASVFMRKGAYSGRVLTAKTQCRRIDSVAARIWYHRDIDRNLPPKLNAGHEEPHLAQSLGVRWLRDLRTRARVLLHADPDRRRGGAADWAGSPRRRAPARGDRS